MKLADIRRQLVEAFEPEFRIIGNTTQREIVQAIDELEADFRQLLTMLVRSIEAATSELKLSNEMRDVARAECNRLLEENRELAGLRESHADMLSSYSRCMIEVDRLRPIYEAAKVWRAATFVNETFDARHDLVAAIAAAEKL